MELDYREIAERLKKALAVEKDCDLARMLGHSPQAFCNCKKKGFPLQSLLLFANEHGISADWLLFGKPSGCNTSVLEEILVFLESRQETLAPERKARLVRAMYEEVAIENKDLRDTIKKYEGFLG
jgi:hypothetical protein